MIIENGTGNGNKMAVNGNNEAKTFSITESESQAAAENGDAYNLNTGELSLSSSTSSGLMYFKNDEDEDVVIESIAFGLRDITGGDGFQQLYVVRNPTGGTLVDATTNVSMNQNRNFGSSKTLKSTSLAYKMTASNQTLTGGNDIVLFYAGTGRLFASINIEIPKGSAIGLRLDSASLTGTCYAALVVHKKDAERTA
jgi:hypothetical protein